MTHRRMMMAVRQRTRAMSPEERSRVLQAIRAYLEHERSDFERMLRVLVEGDVIAIESILHGRGDVRTEEPVR